MKILHICQRDDPDTGGALRVGEALVRAQLDAAEEAWVLFLYGPPAQMAKSFEPNVACLELDSSRQALHGMRKLKQAIEQINPDIIHSHDGILWPRLTYLKRKVPVVTHAHSPPGEMKKMKDRLGWPLTQMTTDCLIGVSQHTIDTWLDHGYASGQVHLIPNGVDFNRFRPLPGEQRDRLRRDLGLPVERRLMLWIGRLHKGTKGTDRAERVAANLPEDTTLVVVGQGPEYAGMCERCREMIADGRMIMVGSSPHPEEYYKVADQFLFTSYQDAFGLVILEAVACELPVVAFEVTEGGGAVELLKDFNAVKLEDGFNSDDLMQAIENGDELQKSAAARREKAMCDYAWSALSHKTVAVYETTLNQWKGKP